MMRRVLIAAVLLWSPVLIAPASALQADDTMSTWKNASDADRAELLKRLPNGTDKPAIRRCMDETSSVPGHADLAIAEVAKICAKSEGAGQPV